MIVQIDFKKLSQAQQILWLSGLLDEQRSCLGKQKYSEASAVRAAQAMERKIVSKKFDVYCCLWCHQWHIGGSVER